jgi:hypothetical protein
LLQNRKTEKLAWITVAQDLCFPTVAPATGIFFYLGYNFYEAPLFKFSNTSEPYSGDLQHTAEKFKVGHFAVFLQLAALCWQTQGKNCNGHYTIDKT